LTTVQVEKVIDSFMISLVLGASALKDPDILKSASKFYIGWAETQLWLRNQQRMVMDLDRNATNPFNSNELVTFEQLSRIVAYINRRFGEFQNSECRTLKNALLDAGDYDTGLVRLSDFYTTGLSTSLQFRESEQYLQSLGALDRSKKGEPHVIIPNYVLSKANCLMGASSAYSICCMSECEGLLAQIEQKVASSEASPELLVSIVGNLSSSTVDALGALSQELVDRLDVIAQRQGGSVRLHDHLFEQWLNRAFPRECPYPRAADATSMPEASYLSYASMRKYRHAADKVSTSTPQGKASALNHGLGVDAGEDVLSLPWDVLLYADNTVHVVRQMEVLLAGLFLVGLAACDKLRRGLGLDGCMAHTETLIFLAF
jgi:hypothetical protein